MCLCALCRAGLSKITLPMRYGARKSRAEAHALTRRVERVCQATRHALEQPGTPLSDLAAGHALVPCSVKVPTAYYVRQDYVSVPADERNLTRTLALLALASFRDATRVRFAESYRKESGMSSSHAQSVAQSAYIVFLCSSHLNQSRHAADAEVADDASTVDWRHCRCVSANNRCCGKVEAGDVEKPLRAPPSHSLGNASDDDVDRSIDLDDMVRCMSKGYLGFMLPNRDPVGNRDPA
jgi:hypothetical protein